MKKIAWILIWPGLVSCSGDAGYLVVSPMSASLAIGESRYLTAELIAADGSSRNISDEVSWSVDDRDVLSLSAEGTIRARKSGVASVTAVKGRLRAHSLIGVVDHRVQGPLSRSDAQTRYFMDAAGRFVFLTGSHTWSSLQDNGKVSPPPSFDYSKYLDFLVRNNHNFFRLWRWEQGNWMTEIEGNYWFTPQPFLRTGPGEALDGKAKYDLNRFDDAYFERIRKRVGQAGDRGIFVSVMLFDGWSLEPKGVGLGNPWDGHPLNAMNNINGLDGDTNGDGRGLESHSLANAGILAVQTAYVRRIYQELADLNNVLYEVSNETRGGSAEWQEYMIEYLHELSRQSGRTTLVGMTVERPAPSNDALFRSSADWVSPYRISNNPLEATPQYSDKVVVHDTDHLCGVCGSVPWVWQAATQGLNLLLMDFYDTTPDSIGRMSMHMADLDWNAIRRNMGYARVLIEQMDLLNVEPLGGLSSTGYCLANTKQSPHQYLLFVPAGIDKVSLDLRTSTGQLNVFWLSTENGRLLRSNPISGGQKVSLNVPMHGTSALLIAGGS